RVVFSCSTKEVGCRACGRKLVESLGGKARILGTVVKKLD
ncbi:MAG: 30S ribosomal protein S27e, partial [Thaumarchaeota archaeon]